MDRLWGIWEILCSDSGMVIIKILRLFSYSGLSIKLRNLEIGLYFAQEYTQDNIFIIFFFEYLLFVVSKQTSFYIKIK